MLENKFITLAFCFFTTMLPAQSVTDSVPTKYDQLLTAPQDSVSKYKKLAINTFRNGDLEGFKENSRILLHIAKAHNLTAEQVTAFVYLAAYHQQLDQYDDSLQHYMQAEQLAESLPEDSHSRILVQVNLGNLYNHLQDYENVKIAMKKVIAMAAQQENPEAFTISAYNSLGTANLNQGNYTEALAYMFKVKALAEKTERNDQIIRALINIAECQRYLERYEEAIKNGKLALDRCNQKEPIELKAAANLGIGTSYFLSDRALLALPGLKSAKQLAMDGGFMDIKMEAHQYLAKSYEQIDSIHKSLEEQKAYTETREKFLKTLSKTQQLKFEEDSKKTQKIISRQEKSIGYLVKQQQFYFGLGIVLFILLAVFVVLYYKHKKRLIHEAALLKDGKALLQNENIALKDKLKTLAQTLSAQKQAEEDKEETTQKKSSLSPEDQQYYMKHILNYMDENKPYLNPEIKQSDIARKLDISLHLFSEILNICFEKNFNNFINLYRVDKAKQLMQNRDFKNYKILAIGYEAGFPSKSSFNRVFKNLVGQTPTEYQNQFLDQTLA